MRILASVSAKFSAVSNILTAGERMTAEWKPATELRNIVDQKEGLYHRFHGGEFLVGLGMFLDDMDAYNLSIGPAKLKFVVQEHRGDVIGTLLEPRMPGKTLTQIGGIGLQRLGRIHPGHFFRDEQGNTGFEFGTNGHKSRYTCDDDSSFGAFADQLLSRRAPVAGPAFKAK